jgi:hypothetical protein
MRKISKKAVLVGATIGVMIGLTVTAVAYWSTGGSGTGQGATGTTSNNLVVTGATSASDLVPGSNGTLNVTITNPNSYSVKYLGVGSIGQAVATAHTACTSAMLVVTLNSANAQEPVGGTVIPPLGHIDRVYANALAWADSNSVDQNECKSVTLDVPVLTLN